MHKLPDADSVRRMVDDFMCGKVFHFSTFSQMLIVYDCKDNGFFGICKCLNFADCYQDSGK